MKKIIRKGTFETNSSSSHSLVVKKESTYMTEEEIKKSIWLKGNGKIHFCGYELEFGRCPDAPLFKFYDKLRYLIASYSYDYEKIKEIEEVVKEIIHGCNGFEFSLNYNNERDYGYIDHDSLGLVNKYMEDNNISIKEFLTNKKYIIILDGDEYNMWENFKKAGLINTDLIKEEKKVW